MKVGENVYIGMKGGFAPAILVQAQPEEGDSWLLAVFYPDGIRYEKAKHGGGVGQWQGRDEGLIEELETSEDGDPEVSDESGGSEGSS